MQASLSPQEFVQNWQNTQLSERASYQAHFMDVCRLVGYETPSGTGEDRHGNAFQFDMGLKKQAGGQGFADVYLQGHFAIEYKAPERYKDLRAAYDQLLQYRENLNNPPLLIVTDIQNWEIHTNWSNTEKRVYTFTHEEIATRTVVQDYLRHIFTDPAKLHPNRNTEQVTADAAKGFQIIADNMREWQADPERIAHFLTKLVFCLFAEDVSLLPSGPKGETGIFSEIIESTRSDSVRFRNYAEQLFKAMADGGDVLFQEIPYFNGSLFDDIRVEDLSLEALTALENASKLNWESVEPAIFGTLFERSLDPAKRSQLGAHYTSREDILLIVEPVLMRPLEREWEKIQAEAAPIREKYDAALESSNRRQQTTHSKKLEALRETMLGKLRDITVLDPACGSGNFLYVALQRLMDMEKEVIKHPLFAGPGLSEPFPEVHPRQMYGMEINPIAHALASIVVWIGYLQWRRSNGYLTRPKEPILEDIHDNIQCMDAILAYDENGKPIEPEWAAVDVIIGNPPFLGSNLMRGELGDVYVENLRGLYDERLSGAANLVTYWFERARVEIKSENIRRVGLIATNSIRGRVNRQVLQAIKDQGDIFMAWSDREWLLEGAAVRVSMVGFDNGSEKSKELDGELVDNINADLTTDINIGVAKSLNVNQNISMQGVNKVGAFDIDHETATTLLQSVNPSGVNNNRIIKPIVNSRDIVQNSSNRWIIDFAVERNENEVAKYQAPYSYLKQHVYPKRRNNNRATRAQYWWLFGEPVPPLRPMLNNLNRYIVTPRVSKHRIFVWLETDTLPSDALIAIMRDDDYFFGVLHCKLHEVWSLALGAWHGKGNDPRYTPTTTFETFPFPYVPGQEDESAAAYQAISAAAKQLHLERDAWLNPNGAKTGNLKNRTLTNLYNALAVFRGEDSMKIKPEAGDFAPRLAELHDALDKAVCDAYGWSYDILDDEEEILRHLLALNLERAENQASE